MLQFSSLVHKFKAKSDLCGLLGFRYDTLAVVCNFISYLTSLKPEPCNIFGNHSFIQAGCVRDNNTVFSILPNTMK